MVAMRWWLASNQRAPNAKGTCEAARDGRDNALALVARRRGREVAEHALAVRRDRREEEEEEGRGPGHCHFRAASPTQPFSGWRDRGN